MTDQLRKVLNTELPVRPDFQVRPTVLDYSTRGTMLAGALFPISVQLWFTPLSRIIAEPLELLGILTLSLVLGALYGSGIAGVLGFFFQFAMRRFVECPSDQGENFFLAGFAGGLTGFFGVGIIAIPMLVLEIDADSYAITALAMATLMGQVGAIGGAVVWVQNRHQEFNADPFQEERIRFNVSKLFRLTFVLALALTLLKLLQVPLANLAIIVGSWTVLQSISLAIFVIIARRIVIASESEVA